MDVRNVCRREVVIGRQFDRRFDVRVAAAAGRPWLEARAPALVYAAEIGEHALLIEAARGVQAVEAAARFERPIKALDPLFCEQCAENAGFGREGVADRAQ